jgi:hypothetical protein
MDTEALKTLVCYCQDIYESCQYPTEIRAGAFQLKLITQKNIRQLNCPHRNTQQSNFRLHNDEYSYVKCLDCGKLIDLVRL